MTMHRCDDDDCRGVHGVALTRRGFLRAGAGLTAYLLLGRAARPAHAAGPPVLVALYMRGGADGLNIVIPAGDPAYAAARPIIRVPADQQLPLTNFFGLNPHFAPVLPLYQAGSLAAIHACGSPDPTRSHFVSQSYMERGAPGNRALKDGWLNRYLALAGGGNAVAGITLKTAKVKALAGAAPSLAFPRLATFRMTGDLAAERTAALAARYELTPGTLLGSNVLAGLGALDALSAVSTATSVTYPSSPLGEALADAAALIKADVGVRVIAVDAGGWDHHFDEFNAMRRSGGDLAASLAAFYQDLGAHTARTLTLCMSEFGRRVAENGAEGCDHGRGGVMLAVGGGIAGGRVLTRGGQWPGLAPDKLVNGQDLAVTTDFRDVFAEVLHRHLGVSLTDCASVLPGHTVASVSFPGVFL